MKLPRFIYKKKIKNGRIIHRILHIPFKGKKLPPPPPENPWRNLFVPPAKEVGVCTYSGRDILIESKEASIGSFCSIGCGVRLGHGEHPLHMLTTSPYLYFDELEYKREDMPSHPEYWEAKAIHIGNDVWIGDRVFVKNGVNIGDGAVVGAGSLVTKDVPPYAIVAGVPARIIRFRFDEQTISKLLELKWWELDEEIIKRIPYDDIEQAISFLQEVRSNTPRDREN